MAFSLATMNFFVNDNDFCLYHKTEKKIKLRS